MRDCPRCALWQQLSVALVLVVVLFGPTALPVLADDWPCYLHDVARSGVTAEGVRPPLTEQWAFTPVGVPIPAWADPQDAPVEGNYEQPRLRFDDAYHVAVADGMVYFGSSADNKVYALDAATGRVRWSFFTDGPVRLAPAVSDGRVYVGSDDGSVYCLSAADGKLVWRFQVAPTNERLLARGRMISLWPVRTGVLVDGGVAYFCAGVFPSERVYICAVRADDGRLIWKNDTMGDSDAGRYDFSPQGYLLASPTTLYVPCSRRLPAAFDRQTGKFNFQRSYGWRSTGIVGGTYALLIGDQLYSGSGSQVVGYEQASGKIGFAFSAGRRLVVTADTSYVLSDKQLSAFSRQTYQEAASKLNAIRQQISNLNTTKPAGYEEKVKALEPQEKAAAAAVNAATRWQVPLDNYDSLIVAGSTVLAGGQGQVVGFDAATGKETWRGAVNGFAKGLAVSGGLYVSTDKGTIHCFRNGPTPPAAQVQPPKPYPWRDLAGVYDAAATQILKDTGVTKGFCLVLGCGTGGLAYSLAKQTQDLMIYAVDPDAEKVKQAREALDAAGLYGVRVTVDCADLSRLPYSDYFANLVVSDDAVARGVVPPSAAEAYRVTKPIGGVIYIGQPVDVPGAKRLSAQDLMGWVQGVKRQKADTVDTVTVAPGGLSVKLTRGPLDGAGSWTHQYGDPGNTASSEDTALRCPLGVLWYGDPGPDKAVNRHAGAAAPLSINGRVFYQGMHMTRNKTQHLVLAFDAYNGVQLWEREIPGAYRVGMARECSNLAATEDSLFVATGSECLRLDPATGETLMTYQVPDFGDGATRKWAYVAAVGKILYGSGMETSQFSDRLFALDIASGAVLWKYSGKSIRNNTISISDGRIFFADSSATSGQRQEVLKGKIQELMARKGIDAAAAEKELASADVRVAVALDATTGAKIWERPVDLTDCGSAVLTGIATRGVMLFCGAHQDGHYWPQFLGGEYAARSIVALSAKDGSLLWSKPLGYRIRPLVIGDTIYAEPWGFDLYTGQPKARIHPVSGQESRWEFERPGHHCGTISGCPTGLFFRSYTIAYYDLLGDYGTNHFGGQRPGCWINMIPANGLLVVPEASSGCVCLISIHCTTVFKPRSDNKAWGIYDAPGRFMPVKRLGINLGAPGDRKDARGNLWLSYPRPSGRMRFTFDVSPTTMAEGGYFQHPAEYFKVDGTDTAWLFASGISGLTKCIVPLLSKDDGGAIYTVRLGFADTENQKPGERVFDIKLQGTVVAPKFDIIQAAGGPNRAVVKEFRDIQVQDNLLIELVPSIAEPTKAQAPLLNFIEVERTRMLTVGLGVPDFTLSEAQTEQTAELRIANFRDQAFDGTLQVIAPQGFAAAPAETPVSLDVGKEMTVPLKLTVAAKGQAGRFEVVARLIRKDGMVETERRSSLEYLGPRDRLVVPVSEDAYVTRGQPTTNFGNSASLMVDGGNDAMGDDAHSLSYLRFRLDVPGKPLWATLRIRVSPAENSQSADSGRVCLVEEPWEEAKITYANRPKPGAELAKLGKIDRDVWVERRLNVDLTGRRELSLVLEPTSTDGAGYYSREGKMPAELVIEYVR